MINFRLKTIYFLTLVFLLSQSYLVNAQEIDDDPSLKEQKLEEGYVVDLRDLIKKSKKKIENVNDKIKEQARLRRNQQREAKAREYYEKAMRLSNEGKLKEAQEYWTKAIKITEHPEMKDFISESTRRTKKQEEALRKEESKRLKRLEVERGYSVDEVETTYEEAVTLYKQKKFIFAREMFERCDEMFPDHKATRSYLMLIEQKIQEEQEKIIEVKVREEAIAKRKEKERWRKEIESKEQDRQDMLNEKAEGLYQKALNFYNTRQFEKAKDTFKELQWVLPNYKKTPIYLEGIDQDIKDNARHQSYDRQKQYELELEEDRLAEIKKREALVNKKAEEERIKVERLKEEADFYYDSAVSLYKKNFIDESLKKFNQCEDIYPNFRATRKYINKIHSKLDKIEKDKKSVTSDIREKQLIEKNEEDQHYSDLVKITDEGNELTAKEKARQMRLQADHEYKLAVDLFKSGLYKQSQNRFKSVQSIIPNFKSSANYLKKIAKKLDEPVDLFLDQKPTSSSQIVQEQKASTPNYPQTSFRQKAQNTQENEIIQNQNKQNYEVADNQVILDAIEQRKNRFNKEAEEKYQEALQLFRNKQYLDAKMKFIQIEALYPGYKDTLSYLSQIDDKMLNNNYKTVTSSAVNVVPKQTMNGSNKNYIEPAAVQSVSKQSAKKVVEKEQKSSIKIDKKDNLQSEKETESQRQRRIARNLKEKYNNAVQVFRNKDFDLAKSEFIEINQESPGYRATERYLQKIDDEIFKAKKETTEEQIVQDIAVHEAKVETYQPRGNIDDILSKEERDEYGWERRRDERVALLKAKEEYLDGLKGREYQKFKEELEYERKALEAVEKERQRREEKRKRELKKKLSKEEFRQWEEEKKLKNEAYAKDRAKEREMLVKEKEEQRIYEEKMREEARVRKEEELQEKREAEERIKRLKEEELEAKRRADELARQAQEEEDALKAIEEKKKEKEERQKLIERHRENMLKGNELTEQEKELQKAEEKEISRVLAEKKAKKELAEIKKQQSKLKEKQKEDLNEYQRDINRKLVLKDKAEKRRIYKIVCQLYDEGVDLYRQGDYRAAKAKFSMVDGMWPGFKSSWLNIKKADFFINQEEKGFERSVQRKVERNLHQQEKERLEKEREEERQKNIETEKAEKEEKEKIAQEIREKKEKEEAEKLRMKQEMIEAKRKAAQEKREAKLKKRNGDDSEDGSKAESNESSAEKKLEKKDQLAEKNQDSIIEEKNKSTVQDNNNEISQNQEQKLDEKTQELIKKQQEELEKEEKSRKKLEEELAQERKRRVELEEKTKREQEKEALRLKKEQEDQLREAKIKEEEENKRIAKEKAELERKEKEALEEKKKAELKEMRDDIEKSYSLAKGLYHSNNYSAALDQLRKFESMLGSKLLPDYYVTRMRKRLGKDKDRINTAIEREKMQEEERLHRIEMERTKKQLEMKQLKNRELEKLRSRISEEEEKLRIEKERELARLEKEKELLQRKSEKEKEDIQEIKEDLMQDQTKKFDQNKSGIKKTIEVIQDSSKEKKTKQDLEELVRIRQEQLRKEREAVQKKFEEDLSSLYEKGLNLQRNGFLTEAKKIFDEIELMSPDYKKTLKILSEIERDMKSNPKINLSAKQESSKAPSRVDLINSSLDHLENSY